MDVVDRRGDLPISDRRERGDAARNRLLLLDAARSLIAQRSADDVTTDDIVAAAGVGKGTLFRRFGNRAGLMLELLDDDERTLQQAFMFGPPPLGPDAPAWDRLVAFGRERLRFVHTHRVLLSQITGSPQARFGPVFSVLHTHVRMLLAAAGCTGDLSTQADALLALLDADYVIHQLDRRTLDEIADAWESLARKLCEKEN